MPEFPDQFSSRLTDSGIVSVDQLNNVHSLLEAADSSVGTDHLKLALLEPNLVTDFQLQVLADGEPDQLVPGDRKR